MVEYRFNAFSFSIIIEVLQELVPERAFEFKDLAANLAGIIVGIIFSTILISWRGYKAAK